MQKIVVLCISHSFCRMNATLFPKITQVLFCNIRDLGQPVLDLWRQDLSAVLEILILRHDTNRSILHTTRAVIDAAKLMIAAQHGIVQEVLGLVLGAFRASQRAFAILDELADCWIWHRQLRVAA